MPLHVLIEIAKASPDTDAQGAPYTKVEWVAKLHRGKVTKDGGTVVASGTEGFPAEKTADEIRESLALKAEAIAKDYEHQELLAQRAAGDAKHGAVVADLNGKGSAEKRNPAREKK